MSQSTNQPIQTNHVPADNASDVGRMDFIVRSALSGLRTAIPVKVIAVTNSGGISPIGMVDVQPLVSSVDGNGQTWAHGIIHGVPYMRIQGGSNGIIIDPVVGDIGIGTVCDRDISTVKNTKAVFFMPPHVCAVWPFLGNQLDFEIPRRVGRIIGESPCG